MKLQIECPISNEHLLIEAKKEYELAIKNRDLYPVFLVADLKNKTYFVSRFFKRESVECYNNFLILERF